MRRAGRVVRGVLESIRSLLVPGLTTQAMEDEARRLTDASGAESLFLGVPGLFWGGRWARRLGVFAILGGIAMYFCCRSGQALLPFFVPMMVVAALGVVQAPRWRRALAALALVRRTWVRQQLRAWM